MNDFLSEPVDSTTMGRRWARWISDALNPLIVTVYLLVVLIWDQQFPIGRQLYHTGISLLFFTLIPLWILIRFKSAGRISSFDIEIRNQRIRPYIWALLSYAIGWGLLEIPGISQTQLVSTIVGCYLFNSAVGLLLTMRWKISIHTASLGTVLSFSWWIYYHILVNHPQRLYVLAILSSILFPLLMWSRWKLQVHTLKEIAAGAVIALVLTSIEVYLLLI